VVEGGEERAPLLADFELVGVLAREGVGRRASGEVALIEFETGRRLFQDAHVDVRYWLKHDPTVDLERIQGSLGQAWSYELKKSVIIGQAADERAFRNGVRFGGLLALVLGLYVIFHTLSMSLIERVREVGVLHALGASRAQIGRVFFCEALVVAGLGGVLGLAGGCLLALGLGRAGISTLGTGEIVPLREVPWRVVLPLAAAGVGIALCGSVYPLARARATDTVAALRGEESAGHSSLKRSFQLASAGLLALILPGVYFVVVPIVGQAQRELVSVLLLVTGVLALLVAVPLVVPAFLAWFCLRLAGPLRRLWPLSGRLAAGAMQRGASRVAGAVAAVALVTAGYVGLRGMTRSLEAEIDDWSRAAYLDKLFVRGAPPRPAAELRAALLGLPGVRAVEANDLRTYAPFLILGANLDELERHGPCREDPLLAQAMREQRGVILSTRLAQHRGHALGDELHVTTPRGTVESLPVVAISDAYGYFPHPDERLYAVISERWMKELFCLEADAIASFALRLESGADAEVVAASLRELYPEHALVLESGEYVRRWHALDIARDFVLFDVLILLVALLAGLGVLNGQLLASLERSKELGILKALGMTSSQVAGTVLIEEATVGTVAGVLGAALGAGLAPVIVASLAVISGLPLRNVGPGAHAALGIAGAVLLACAAGLYPIWRLRRASALPAIRTGG
jgi:putative ABC transport system permease protein